MKISLLKLMMLCLLISIIIPTTFLLHSIFSNIPIDWKEIAISFVITFLVTASISTVNYSTRMFLHRRYTWTAQPKKRFVLQFFFTNLNAAVIISIFFLAVSYITGDWITKRDMAPQKWFENVLIAIIVNTILVAIGEAVELFQLWKSSLIHAEKLKRERVEYQYNSLRNQINPHFLFNCLNSLASLVQTDKDKALDFIMKFSKMYRYVLDMSHQIVVTLESEIDFITSYLYLQQIRYGANLKTEININPTLLQMMLPPLSLQLLIENAIKHNEISTKNTLIIKIYNDHEYLVVENNLQIRTNKEPSTGVGINNLKERYLHITHLVPVFEVMDNTYIAKIPILKED